MNFSVLSVFLDIFANVIPWRSRSPKDPPTSLMSFHGLPPSLSEKPPAVNAAPVAPEFAGKIEKLMELKADPEAIAEAYAAFERTYPQATLSAQAQLQIAQLLETSGRRLLAIEAYRKAAASGDSLAQLGLLRVLAQSTATYNEALTVAAQARKMETDPARLVQIESLVQTIQRRWEAIFAFDAKGREMPRPKGPCSVLCEATSKINVPVAADIVMRHLGTKALDTRVALQRAPGIIARRIDPEAAERMARDLQEAAIPVVVLDEENCPALPDARIVMNIRIGTGGSFELETDQGPALLDPAHVRLAVFSYVPLSEAIRSCSYFQPLALTSRWKVQAEKNYTSAMSSSSRNNLLGLLDLYTFEPLKRYRLAVGRTPVNGVVPAGPGMPSPTFEAMAKRIVSLCPNCGINHTLDILFSDMAIERITHPNLQALDNQAEWLFLLAYNNAPGE